ncbi:hypothetical protein GCM10010187_13870 [Actinomadura coerulea]|nr:hypothetical protein GCM10010187_13870 [Actinomadura coerulea]
MTAAPPATSAARWPTGHFRRSVRARRSRPQAGPPATSAAGSLIAVPSPASAPAARERAKPARPAAAPPKTASAATIGAIARTSLCAPATRWNRTSGLHVHSSAVRSRRSSVVDIR